MMTKQRFTSELDYFLRCTIQIFLKKNKMLNLLDGCFVHKTPLVKLNSQAIFVD
jgi:hypothetical protein